MIKRISWSFQPCIEHLIWSTLSHWKASYKITPESAHNLENKNCRMVVWFVGISLLEVKSRKFHPRTLIDDLKMSWLIGLWEWLAKLVIKLSVLRTPGKSFGLTLYYRPWSGLCSWLAIALHGLSDCYDVVALWGFWKWFIKVSRCCFETSWKNEFD